ncbi:phosphoglycerate kinase, partial [Phenylobacterium sp.]
MTFKTLDDAALSGKRALVRVDLNVPMAKGEVTDDTRLKAAKPTVDKLRAGGAKVILLAHFDRPKGQRVPEMSLFPVVRPLAEVLGCDVAFAQDCVGDDAAAAVAAMKDG